MLTSLPNLTDALLRRPFCAAYDIKSVIALYMLFRRVSTECHMMPDSERTFTISSNQKSTFP
jgi:hypothetical protein